MLSRFIFLASVRCSAFSALALFLGPLFCPSLIAAEPSAGGPAVIEAAKAPRTNAPAVGKPSQVSVAAPASSPATNSPALTNVVITGTNDLASSTNSLDDKFRLGIGDRLSFRIVEDLEDPHAMIVTDSGDLEVPLIGRVPALEKTCRQLAAEIKSKLEEEYYYHATVILALDQYNHSRGKVYLAGYIRLPGPQDIPSDEVFTLSKAVMRAGGFADYADKKRVRVTRNGGAGDPGGKILEIDVGAILEEGRANKDIRLEVGDVIFVPSRLFKF